METDARTRDRVARALLSEGPMTATQLAERLDLSAAGVRRHLDHLEAEGTVTARELPLRTQRGRGRPAKQFLVTELGREQFEQSYDDLAVEALRFMSKTAGPDAVQRFAEHRARFIREGFATVSAEQPELSPAQVLAAVFSAEGYAASVRQLPVVGEQLCQQHCPVSHVAHEFPQLCDAETAVISDILGTHVQRLATIAHGDGVCTTCIPNPSTDHTKKSPKEMARA